MLKRGLMNTFHPSVTLGLMSNGAQTLKKVLNLIVEWHPRNETLDANAGQDNKVSVIQYATDTAAMILQLNKFNDTLPHKIKDTLRNPDIVKVGVGTYYDMMKLQKDCNIPVRGYLDIGMAFQRAENDSRCSLKHTFYKCFGYVSNISYYPTIMPSNSTMYYLSNSVDVTKPKTVQMSDWAAPELNNVQLTYAAHDALMGKCERLCPAMHSL
jgi:ribonuclease D